MYKYKVEVPVDYVSGHLRYGHKEGYIDSEVELTEDEIKAIAKEDAKYWEVVVDDYRVNDYGDCDFDNITFTKIEGE